MRALVLPFCECPYHTAGCFERTDRWHYWCQGCRWFCVAQERVAVVGGKS